MKTKKLFLTALFVATGILCVNSAKAQEATANTGNESKIATVTVNIKLSPVQSLMISDGIVNIHYNNATAYQNGLSVKKDDQLIVFSTGGYSINVASNQDFTAEGDANKISASDVSIKAEGGSNVTGFTPNEVTLGTGSGTTLITSNNSANESKYTITYNNGAEAIDRYKTYNTSSTVDKIYTANVIYTIAPAN